MCTTNELYDVPDMTSLKKLIQIDKNLPTPIYLQITNAIIYNIRRGILRRRFKIPGARELAADLNIHRKTLQNALDELMAQGWLEIIPRKGTFVVDNLPEINPAGQSLKNKQHIYPDKTLFQIDEKKLVLFPSLNSQADKNLILDDGLPDIRTTTTEILMRECRNLSKLNAFRKYYRYGSSAGTDHLRKTLAKFLTNTRALPISPKNILITRGAQMGFYLTSRLLIKPGDNVVVGEPGYFITNFTFTEAGASILKVPVDEYGINVDYIERICKRNKIKLLYVIPHHHYPTTVTLIPERRIRLLELAAKYKFAILEDDYDYDFHYNSSPVLPMASLDNHGNVIYIGTLTKTLVPSIRIGFIIAPENFINAISHIRRVVDWQGNSMMEVAIAELYRNGTIERHIKKVVKLYRERRDHFCKLLKDQLGNQVTFKIPDGGMSVWTSFNKSDLKEISKNAAEKGLSVSDGSLFNTSDTNYNSARLGFASLNFQEMERAINILKNSV